MFYVTAKKKISWINGLFRAHVQFIGSLIQSSSGILSHFWASMKIFSLLLIVSGVSRELIELVSLQCDSPVEV